jgi:hypothetical protein
MPSNDGVGGDDDQRVTPARPEAREQDPEHSVAVPQGWALPSPLEDLDLMAKGDVLEGEHLSGSKLGAQ